MSGGVYNNATEVKTCKNKPTYYANEGFAHDFARVASQYKHLKCRGTLYVILYHIKEVNYVFLLYF